MAEEVPAPFYITYEAPGAPLPAWLSYTSSPVITTIITYSYATYVAGVPTLVGAEVTLTQYETGVIQLPLTVDVQPGLGVGFPYTTAGGTGPTVVSVLGATAGFTLGETTGESTVEVTTATRTSVVVTSTASQGM